MTPVRLSFYSAEDNLIYSPVLNLPEWRTKAFNMLRHARFKRDEPVVTVQPSGYEQEVTDSGSERSEEEIVSIGHLEGSIKGQYVNRRAWFYHTPIRNRMIPGNVTGIDFWWLLEFPASNGVVVIVCG